jgi:hypothetical protein
VKPQNHEGLREKVYFLLAFGYILSPQTPSAIGDGHGFPKIVSLIFQERSTRLKKPWFIKELHD